MSRVKIRSSGQIPIVFVESPLDVLHANQAPLPVIWRHSRSSAFPRALDAVTECSQSTHPTHRWVRKPGSPLEEHFGQQAPAAQLTGAQAPAVRGVMAIFVNAKNTQTTALRVRTGLTEHTCKCLGPVEAPTPRYTHDCARFFPFLAMLATSSAPVH